MTDPDWAPDFPDFPGQRPPFARGNDLSVRHSSYAVVQLAPRAQELAAEIRQVIPLYSPADEYAVAALALILAQLERASIALAESDEHFAKVPSMARYDARLDALARLRADARGWANTA